MSEYTTHAGKCHDVFENENVFSMGTMERIDRLRKSGNGVVNHLLLSPYWRVFLVMQNQVPRR